MTEKGFVQELTIVANQMNCLFVDIPDIIPTRDRFEDAKRRLREKKRPADGILLTPHGASLIELKIGYNTALPHQKHWAWKARIVNAAAYFFIRRIDKPGVPTVYQLFDMRDINNGWNKINEFTCLKEVIIEISKIQKKGD